MTVSSASWKTLDDAFGVLEEVAKETGLSTDKSMENYRAFRKRTAMLRSDDDARDEAKPKIRDFYELHPDGDFDKKEVTKRVGLKPVSRSDQRWVGNQIRQLRLGSKQAAE